MALFFDGAWFDDRLAKVGLSRSDVAAALGLTRTEIDELWKDQRELGARDVRIIAGLIGAAAADVAEHAGISTPVPRAAPEPADPTLAQRLDRIERDLAEIKALLRSLTADK